MIRTEYITEDGDRLDGISSKAYGDPYRAQVLLDANPALPILPSYPAGIRLIVPVLEPVKQSSANLLPPWKRNENA